MQGEFLKRTHIPKPQLGNEGWEIMQPSDAPNGTSQLLKTEDPPLVRTQTPLQRSTSKLTTTSNTAARGLCGAAVLDVVVSFDNN